MPTETMVPIAEHFFENDREQAGQRLPDLVANEAKNSGLAVSSVEEDLGPRLTLSKNGEEVGVIRFDDGLSATVGGPKRLAIVLDIFNSKGQLEPFIKEFSFENLDSFVKNIFTVIKSLPNKEALKAAA